MAAFILAGKCRIGVQLCRQHIRRALNAPYHIYGVLQRYGEPPFLLVCGGIEPKRD